MNYVVAIIVVVSYCLNYVVEIGVIELCFVVVEV